MSEYQQKIDKLGFAIAPRVINDSQIEKLIESLSKLSNLPSKENKRVYGVRNMLNLSIEIRQ